MSIPSFCDKDLVSQMQQGNVEALGELYDRHRQEVYRTALAVTGDYEAANDLLQDVFLRLYRFAGRIDPQRPLEPWLYRMTANLAYTWVKRNRRWYTPLEDLVEWFFTDEDDLPHAIVERRDDWQQAQKTLATLPLPQRIVVVLYYLNNLSLQEIADILEVPVGTVKSRLHYSRQTLKKNLGLDKELTPDLNYESA